MYKCLKKFKFFTAPFKDFRKLPTLLMTDPFCVFYVQNGKQLMSAIETMLSTNQTQKGEYVHDPPCLFSIVHQTTRASQLYLSIVPVLSQTSHFK